MLLRERMEELKENFKVQVFATDIDREAIDHARAGIYPSSIIGDVSPERLARFFDQEQPDGSTYRIRKTIRDMLIFSEQDLIKDPPFSKLDLISCRNLLIYMGGGATKKLMPLFHYALNPGGMLVLGSSESVGVCEPLLPRSSARQGSINAKHMISAHTAWASPGLFAPAGK
jgi:two-component system CheB/CheR fusion protein